MLTISPDCFNHKRLLLSANRSTWLSVRGKELRKILRPAQKSFDEEWYKTAQEVFPEWQSEPQAFDLALALVPHLMEGIAISTMTHQRQTDHKALKKHLEAQLRELAPAEIK